MHRQAYEFVSASVYPLRLEGISVLEFGSYNVNGSVRPLFDDATEYVGVDLKEGPGVDLVADAATLTDQGVFDVVVCCETLEHAEDPRALIDSAFRNLTPGGVLILTAAGPGRRPHGCMGGALGDETYINIDPDALDLWLNDWEAVTISEDHRAGDVYAVATKPEDGDECESS